MKKIQKIITVICILISAALSFISVYLTASGLIITATLYISFLISGSADKAMDRPILSALLGDNGKSITVANYGNKKALNVNIEILPSNLRFFLESLPCDSGNEIYCRELPGNIRVILNYSDETGKKHTKTEDLKFNDNSDYDPTKPLIPIFQ
ncbi:MAG: hypothetical protein PHV39_03855 [Methanomicrobium sp.]|nr:hypothetical protein [Methanomicrobium sp.]